MRVPTVLLFLAATSCGQTAFTSVDGGGDDVVANPVGRGGNPDNRLAGNCFEETFDAGASSCSNSLPLPCKPCINCAPMQPGDSGCRAPDISILGWQGGGVDLSLRYPVGCVVYLPAEGYYGGPQPCICSTQTGSPSWVCPI